MEKVKVKLATWKWARENTADAEVEDTLPELRLPLLDVNRSSLPLDLLSPRTEMPPGPPNTEKTSAATSNRPSAPHTRPPSEQHDHHLSMSRPHTPTPEPSSEDSEDQPLELRVRPTFSRPPSVRRRHTSSPSQCFHTVPSQDYLSVPSHQRSTHSSSQSRSASPPCSPCAGTRDTKKHVQAISRQLSNLAAEETAFKSHRDSLELMRFREQVGERGKGVNQALMGTKDSFVLARARKSAREREVVLSPILDASPSASVVFLPLPGKVKEKGEDKGGKGGAPLLGDEGTGKQDDHRNCPIYQTERPEWWVRKYEGRNSGA